MILTCFNRSCTSHFKDCYKLFGYYHCLGDRCSGTPRSRWLNFGLLPSFVQTFVKRKLLNQIECFQLLVYPTLPADQIGLNCLRHTNHFLQNSKTRGNFGGGFSCLEIVPSFVGSRYLTDIDLNRPRWDRLVNPNFLLPLLQMNNPN